METLELIKTSHLIDLQLGHLGAAVADGGLRGKILAVQVEWRELAYALSACLCGVEGRPASLGAGKRKTVPKRRGELTDQVGFHIDEDVRPGAEPTPPQ